MYDVHRDAMQSAHWLSKKFPEYWGSRSYSSFRVVYGCTSRNAPEGCAIYSEASLWRLQIWVTKKENRPTTFPHRPKHVALENAIMQETL